MNNDDVIKPPTTVDGKRAEKLQYVKEEPIIFMAALPIVLILIVIESNMFSSINIEYSIESSIRTALIMITAIVPTVFCFKFYRKQNKDREKEVQQILAHGTKTTGNVVEYYHRNGLFSKPGEGSHIYVLAVDYVDPATNQTLRYETPSLSRDPHISKDELPIRATVYVYNGKVYVDEIFR